MMDDSTVQTPPAPRQAQNAGHGGTTEAFTIPTSRSTTERIVNEGMEFCAVVPDRLLPDEIWGSHYTIPLHTDGSCCKRDCECGGAEPTDIRIGGHTTIGAWTWSADRVALFGWQRIGPNASELLLEARVDELEEELAEEQIIHGLTREDEAASEADIEALKTRRIKIREYLRRSRKATVDAERRYDIAFHAAWAGWSVAILLAAFLIESVIA